jgi:hypothetical protein
VLCTDGMANVGAGALEDEAGIPVDASAFYEAVAERARAAGVTVSVLTIKGSEAGMVRIAGIPPSIPDCAMFSCDVCQP